jgi:hypothetical protein
MDALPGARAPRLGAAPPWPLVLISIAAFVGTYYASAVGDGAAALRVHGRLDALLAAAALLAWTLLDATPQGAAMAALTAAAGPAVEAGLISQGLYSYAHADLPGGLPSWVGWVYAAGGPAVGNLGRRVSASLLAARRE